MSKIETIFTHETADGIEGELGIDSSGKLYWNKKLVVTRNKVELKWWVNFAVLISSFSTLVMAIYAVLDYYKK